eukprot:scaffold388699_cov30-Prasinocladus_malaysianus.AAC.1
MPQCSSHFPSGNCKGTVMRARHVPSLQGDILSKSVLRQFYNGVDHSKIGRDHGQRHKYQNAVQGFTQFRVIKY